VDDKTSTEAWLFGGDGDDHLQGGSDLDWYFARLSGKRKDKLSGIKKGEVTTGI